MDKFAKYNSCRMCNRIMKYIIDCPVQIAINFSLIGLQNNTYFFDLTQAGTFCFIPNEYTGCLKIKKYISVSIQMLIIYEVSLEPLNLKGLSAIRKIFKSLYK